jgi:predicted TIM-barrel fold metal-dependent hydrolase
MEGCFMQKQRFFYKMVGAFVLVFMSLLSGNEVHPDTLPTGQGTFIDVHLHFSNQVTGGPANAFRDSDYVTCADNMIALMDKYGLQKAVVMPQPRIFGQPGFYDYTKILPAIRKYPDRLVLGGGGGTLNSMIQDTDPAQVTEEIRDRFRAEAMDIVNAGARAFGEFAALHVSLNPNHVYEEVAPDHPLFLLLADIAAEHGLPIDIHMEAVVTDTPCLENLRRISTKNPDILTANIPAFERLLQHNRQAIIVWQHIGWDNVGQMTIPLLQRMLDDHPNLYLGFKIEERPYQVGTREPMPNRMIDGRKTLKPEWKQFFMDYPDRFLVACDQFVGIPGKTVRPPQYIEETWTAIRQLPDEVIIRIGRENAAKLYHLE